MVRMASVVTFFAVILLSFATTRAGQLIQVVDNLVVSGPTNLAAIDVRKYSEVSILGIASGDIAQVIGVWFLSEAAEASSATIKVGVGACNIPTSGLTLAGCFTWSGEAVQTFKVAGPFLSLALGSGGTSTISLRIWAQ